MCTNYKLNIILNLLQQHLVLDTFLPKKIILYGRVSQPTACVVLGSKAADDIRIVFFNLHEKRKMRTKGHEFDNIVLSDLEGLLLLKELKFSFLTY
jgi:hypothetical protein